MEEPKTTKMKGVMHCKTCDSRVVTYKQSEATPYTVIVSSIVCLVFWFWSVCLLPFIIPLTKAVVTRCVRCDEALQSKHPLGIDILKDEIITLSCGSCAVVVSRKYLLAIFTVLACSISAYWILQNPTVEEKVFIPNTWPQYIASCGSEVLLTNTVTASSVFQNTYLGKTVSWQGYMMKVTEQNTLFFASEHSVVILVKMKPSESTIHADLILSMNKREFEENRTELSKLTRGTLFKFNATFVSMGNEHTLHHLHASYIEKLDGYMEIPSHVHNVNQRYHITVPRPSTPPPPPPPQVSLVDVRDVPQEKKEHSDVHHYDQNKEQDEKQFDHN